MPPAPDRSRSSHPLRAPALYVVGYVPRRAEPETAFRLPVPPDPDERRMGALAAEPRVRKAYYATLDALRTGDVDPDRVAKVARLAHEVKSDVVRAQLTHYRRVMRFVRWSSGGWPIIPAPSAPFVRIAVTPALRRGERATDAELAYRYGWALDWMRMHRWTVGRALAVDWRRASEPSDDVGVTVPVAVEPAGERVLVSHVDGRRLVRA